MGSHSVTCYPTQVNTPRLNPSHTGRYSVYLLRRDGRLSWPSWLDSAPAGSQTSDLSITGPTLNHCTTKCLNKWIGSALLGTLYNFHLPTPTLSPQTLHPKVICLECSPCLFQTLSVAIPHQEECIHYVAYIMVMCRTCKSRDYMHDHMSEEQLCFLFSVGIVYLSYCGLGWGPIAPTHT